MVVRIDKQIGTTDAQLSKILVIHNSYQCLDNHEDEDNQMKIQLSSSTSLQVLVEISGGGEIQIFAASGTMTSRVAKVRKRTSRSSLEKPQHMFAEMKVRSIDINTLPLMPRKVKEGHLRK